MKVHILSSRSYLLYRTYQLNTFQLYFRNFKNDQSPRTWANSQPTLRQLGSAVSRYGAPSVWSHYVQSIRTSNDLEGWHRRINQKANGHSQAFYLLIKLLHEEAQLLKLQMRLLSEDMLFRYQRTKYKNMQALVFQHWQSFNDGEISSYQLLKNCKNLTPSFDA